MSFGFKYLNGSFSISPSGKIEQTTDSEKFKKDIYKMILTDSDGRKYGTQIRKLIGSKMKMNSLENNLKQMLKQAIYNYTLIQKTNQFLSDDETIDNASLDVWVDPDDKNQLDFKIEFILKSGVIIDDLPTQTIKIGQ